jgi:hypothetical protein
MPPHGALVPLRGVGHQYLDRRPELAVFSTSDHDRLWPSRPVTSACAGSSACAALWRPTARGQHHEFEVLVAFCPSEGSQYLKSAARDEVAETEGHDRRWLTTPKKASSRA